MDTFGKMNQTNNSTKRRITKADGFLEAFKGIGSSLGDSVKEDIVKGTAQSAVDQIFNRRSAGLQKAGTLTPDQKLDFGKIVEEEKKKTGEIVKGFYERTRSREKLVFSRREEEVKIQIKALREEIKKLIKATEGVAQETEKVAMEEVVSPGIYHFNFFEKIRNLLALARKRIEESQTWLSLWKSRARRRNYYWAQVRKSGTKFMLSQERYMSTQMG